MRPDPQTLGLVGSVFAEHQDPSVLSAQQQVGDQGTDRLSHFPTVAHAGPGFQSAHGAHCLIPSSRASRSLGRAVAGVGGEEVGAAPGESALALPAPVLRPGSFLARFQHNVTCTEGLP